MAYWRKKRNDITDKIPFPRVPRPSQISSYIKKLLRLNRGEFFELEPMEVTRVNLNGWAQGAILGTFINRREQEIKGGAVLPLFPNMRQIPLIGEHVLVAEYNKQHYYFGIINRKNSVNENAEPGIVTTNTEDTKFGETFERKDIRHLTLKEGEIVYSGRFGQSIKFGTNTSKDNEPASPTFQSPKNSPIIKIRCGQLTSGEAKEELEKIGNSSSGEPVREHIDFDGSSIYLVENGLPFDAETKEGAFDGEQLAGKRRILIKSDGVYVTGRSQIRLKCSSELRINAMNFMLTGKHARIGSNTMAELEPAVKGEELKTFLEEMIDDLLSNIDSAFSAGMATIPNGAPAGGAVASPAFKTRITTLKANLKRKLSSSKILSENIHIT